MPWRRPGAGYRSSSSSATTYALGASIRNFGIVLPLGMSPGTIHERALRSRAVWLKVAAQAGIWHKPTGALIVAYHEDECAVLNEFAGQAAKLGYRCAWLEPDEVIRRSPALRINGLRGGLWSPEEVIVDPREAIAKFPDYLRRTYNVGLCFGKTVTALPCLILKPVARPGASSGLSYAAGLTSKRCTRLLSPPAD